MPKPAATRGYVSMYIKHVMGSDKGADLDFLQGSSGSEVTRDSH
jgi:L-arabonate dehydrase